MKAPRNTPHKDSAATVAQLETAQSSRGQATFEDHRSETLQMKKLQDGFSGSSQREETAQLRTEMEEGNGQGPIQKESNKTGLPTQLKSGIENLSGYTMDDVKVHYNSNKPAQLKAHAYAQGTDIHVAPGQEKHLPHEAWHVVQQKQGRVQPTMQMKGKVPVNDDAGLEKEADVMGAKAMQNAGQVSEGPLKTAAVGGVRGVHQMFFDEEEDKEKLKKVHRWIVAEDLEKWDKKYWHQVVTSGIYKCLGNEENSVYDTPAGEVGRVSNAKFLAQNRRKIVANKLKKSQNAEEKADLKALKKKLKRHRPNEEESQMINPIAHEKGDYFHIKRPSEIKEAVQKLRGDGASTNVLKERLILNINSASVAAGLLEYILAGWEAKEMDWRSRVTSAKFLGMSPEARTKKPNLKFDKVVIYYEKLDRDSVILGAGSMVPKKDRNENISAFYNKMGKGMGIGEEKVDDLGNSFTGRRTETIVNWVMNEKGWDEARAMGEDEFVEAVLPIVRSKMLPSDVKEGILPEPMHYEPKLDEEQQNAMVKELLTGLENTDIEALLKALEEEDIQTTTMTATPLTNLD